MQTQLTTKWVRHKSCMFSLTQVATLHICEQVDYCCSKYKFLESVCLFACFCFQQILTDILYTLYTKIKWGKACWQAENTLSLFFCLLMKLYNEIIFEITIIMWDISWYFWTWKNIIIRECRSLMMLYYYTNKLTDSQITLLPDFFLYVKINTPIFSLLVLIVWSQFTAESMVTNKTALRTHMTLGELEPENLCLTSVRTPLLKENKLLDL